MAGEGDIESQEGLPALSTSPSFNSRPDPDSNWGEERGGWKENWNTRANRTIEELIARKAFLSSPHLSP